MSNLDDERTDAEVSRRINSAPFMTYKEECESLREQVEKLKAELASIDGALNDPRANLTLTTSEIIWELKEQLAALAEQNARMRVALQAMVDEAFARNCGLKIADDALSLPDLTSPVLNRIRAEENEAIIAAANALENIASTSSSTRIRRVANEALTAIRARRK